MKYRVENFIFGFGTSNSYPKNSRLKTLTSPLISKASEFNNRNQGKDYSRIGYSLELSMLSNSRKIQWDIPVPSSSPAEVVPATSVTSIKIPEMIDISPKLSIMRGEVTVGLFKQVMGDYRPQGDDPASLSLKRDLDDPNQSNKVLTNVNLEDARAFSKRLSDLTGRRFRLPTEGEMFTAIRSAKLVGRQSNWTESKDSRGNYLLFCPNALDACALRPPTLRINISAIRIVEDK